MSEYTSEQIFESWHFHLKENPDIRYTNKNRLELVVELTEAFKFHGVPYEEALSYIPQTILKLTTEEGRKGKGKYKGWKESVEADFKASLANAYVEKREVTTASVKSILPDTVKIIEDKWICAWLELKFDGRVPSEIKALAHIPGNSLNISFLKEVFESDWVKSDNVPLWIKSSACLF